MSQSTDSPYLSTKTEKRPEVKKSSEEIHLALKNDQLAKIPLKKRGMKFSEDFDKTSSVIVTNPLPAPLREIPKILSTSEPANKVVNDHVNGEVKPTSDKHLQRISDPLADKSGLVESVESKEKMVADEGERKDEKGQKDLTSAAEKITEASPVVDIRSPNLQVDKENVATEEKVESLPALGVIKTALANHHTQDKASESKPADVRESCIVANLPRETDKLLATADSEIEKSLVEKKQSEGTKMLEVEEATPKQVEAEETAETPHLNEAKHERSGEKPEVKTTTVEEQHREKDQSEASVDSEKAQLSPGVKKDTVEEKDHDKKQDVTPTPEKDEAKISDKSEETSTKSKETPAETSEKQQKDEIKDDSVAAQKKTSEEPQPVQKKNQVIRKEVRIQDEGKQSDSNAEAMEVEEAGEKKDQTEPQVDGKADTTEERSEGKDKTQRNASKAEDPKTETAHKEEEMECEEGAKPTEVEQSSSEVKPSNGEGANEPKDQENLTNDSEKRPCEDKEATGTDRPITGKEKGTETKTEQNDRSKTSTKLEVDGLLKEKTDAEKTAVEEKKEDEEEKKDDDDKEEAAKDVANGVKAPMEAASQRGKRPVHRRRAEVQREERTADSESDTNTGMSLRRSPRISRPTAKAVEISDRKQERVQTEEKQGEDKERKEGEEEEEVAAVEKVVQRKPREKKADQDGQTKPKVSFPFFPFLFSRLIVASANFSSASLHHRSVLNRHQGRKRRKVRWSNTRTRRKKRGSEEEEGGGSDEASSEDDDSEEEEDDSDEDYKVERSRKRRNRHRERRSSDSDTSSDDDLPPNDDPCKHCGLPNHPELVGPVGRRTGRELSTLTHPSPMSLLLSRRSSCATHVTAAITRHVCGRPS